MNKINCNIVRDLLPSYLDKLTCKESNELVEAHVEDCMECKEILAVLSKTVTLDTKEANREIDYLKKIKTKRKRLLVVTALVCTLLFSIITGIGVKVFVIGSPIPYHRVDADKSDDYVGIGTKFDPTTNELTIYGEILSSYTEFSGIKVEESPGLVNAYNVTIYSAERLSGKKEYNRKFEKIIKIPDDNTVYSVYSIGEIPQDTVMLWSNMEYVDEKAEKQLQKLTGYLTEKIGFSSQTAHLDVMDFREILADKCFVFYLWSFDGNDKDFSAVDYAVSEDCERIYYFDIANDTWVLG